MTQTKEGITTNVWNDGEFTEWSTLGPKPDYPLYKALRISKKLDIPQAVIDILFTFREGVLECGDSKQQTNYFFDQAIESLEAQRKVLLDNCAEALVERLNRKK